MRLCQKKEQREKEKERERARVNLEEKYMEKFIEPQNIASIRAEISPSELAAAVFGRKVLSNVNFPAKRQRWSGKDHLLK